MSGRDRVGALVATSILVFTVLAVAVPFASADHILSSEAYGTAHDLTLTITWSVATTGHCCGSVISWNTGDGASGELFDGYSDGTYEGDASGTGSLSDARPFAWTRERPAGITYYNVTYDYSIGGVYTVDWEHCCDLFTGAFEVELAADVPDAPELSAVRGSASGTVDLSWTAPYHGGSPISAYRIYRGPSAGSETLHAEVGAVLSYVDSGLPGGVPVFYRVSAVNGVGEGAPSASASATPWTPPSAPVDLAAATGPGAGQVSLSWAPPADDGGLARTGYTLYVLAGNSETPVSLPAHAASHLDTGLAPSEIRSYQITASNEQGEGPRSNLVSASAHPLPPAPTGLAAERGPGPGKISLSWSSAPAAQDGLPVTAYRLYRGESAGAEAFLLELPSTATSYVDTGLAAGATRHYRVSAVNDAGEGALSAGASATTHPVPTAPQSVLAARGGGPGEIVLSWGYPASDGGLPVTGYTVFRGGASGQLSFLLDLGSEATGYTDSGLPSGATRFYQVRATTAAGDGPRSPETSASTFPPPQAPQQAAARAGPEYGEITLTWQPPLDSGGRSILHYRVFRGETAGTASFLTTVGPGILTYLDSGLPNSVVRYYQVSAVTDAGESPRSSETSAATFTPSAPPPPLPQGVASTSAVWSGAEAFVFGGFARATGGDDITTNAVVRFDPSGNAVTTLPTPLPSPRSGTSAVWGFASSHEHVDGEASPASCHPTCVERVAYIFGGLGPVSTPGAGAMSCHPTCAGSQILKFDPESGASTVVGVLPQPPRANTSAVWATSGGGVGGPASCHPTCVSGVAYIFGGAPTVNTSHDVGAAGCHPTCAGSQIVKFDPETGNSTVEDTGLPSPRHSTSAVSTGPTALIFGGTSSGASHAGAGASSFGDLDEILVFDFQTKSVTLAPTRLPTPRSGTTAFWDGTAAFIVGGFSNGVPINEILRYDPATGSISVVANLPTARAESSVVWTENRAYIIGGDDGQSTLNDIVPFAPTAPVAPSAEAGPAAGQITVSWSPPVNAPVAGIVAYRIYRGTVSDGESFLIEVPGTLTSHVDGDLPPETRFFYKVSAVSALGEGPQSVEVSAVTFTTPLAPRNLVAESGPRLGEITLEWLAPEDDGGTPVTAYRIFRGSSANGPRQLVALVPGDQWTWTDRDRPLLARFHYTVQAMNIAGPGFESNLASAVGTGLPVPLLQG